MTGKCGLCQNHTQLLESHIIPKFVFKWMKATGSEYFRSPLQPNVRLQDGAKQYLLCGDCEQLFSKYESWFSKNVFEQYLSNQSATFVYESELSKFVCSILWRTAVIAKQDNHGEFLNGKIDAACLEWGSYLLSDTPPLNFDEFHMLLIPDDWGGTQPNQYVTRYFTRAIDCHIIDLENDDGWVYAKFARFMMLGRLSGTKPISRFTRIGFEHGVLSAIQFIDDPNFSGYLIDRAETVYEYGRDRISPMQKDVIEKHLQTNSYKIIGSDSERRAVQDYRAKIAPFEPDPSFKYACDCCVRQLVEPEGFLLRTFEVLMSKAFWTQYFKSVNLIDGEQDAPMRFEHFKAIAEDVSPWVICENCIAMFNVDRELAKSFMTAWVENKGSFSPPKSTNTREHLTKDQLNEIALNLVTC